MRESSKLGSALVALALVLAGCTAPSTLSVQQSLPAETSQAPVIPAASTPLVPIGFAGGGALLFVDDAELTQSLDAVVATGSTRIRIDLGWPLLEPERGVYAWESTDRVVDAARARGLDVLGILDYTPPWAAKDASLGVSSPPADAQEYADFAGAVAEHYKGVVSTYEIWNEPNGMPFWAPTADPELYSQMLIASFKTIKAADPAAIVIGGVLGPVPDSPTAMSGLTFLKKMYDAGVRGSFDALSVHPYPSPGVLINEIRSAYAPLRMIGDMRRVMEANGDASKQIWATEFGAPTIATTGFTDEQQATLVHDFVRQWSQMPWAGPVYIHEIRDRLAKSMDREDSFGVLRRDFTPKPAYIQLTRDIASGINDDIDYRTLVAAGRARPELGDAITPVFTSVDKRGDKFSAQEFSEGVLFHTRRGFYSSPQTVLDAVWASGFLPMSDFEDGQQDLDVDGGMRVFYSPETGTHTLTGAILASWTPEIGFPTSDQAASTGPVGQQTVGQQSATFQHGTITWVAGSTPVRTPAQ